MWGFPTSERHEADSAVVLAQLIEALRAHSTPEFVATVAQRRVQIDAERARRAQQIAAAAADAGSAGAINAQWFCARLGERLAPTDIVLNEAIRNGMAVNQQIRRTEPGTLIGLLGGGLGYSGGMALGLRMARPQSRVVNVVGDGSFYFSNPEAVLAVAAHYDLPLLTVVLDNSGWGAVKEATLRMYPKGTAVERREFEAHLAPGMNFAHIASATGAFGLKVEDPAAVEDALDQALAAVDRGQAAVLHVRIASL
jgi:acetolactate synthase-1/2/3 large subunit